MVELINFALIISLGIVKKQSSGINNHDLFINSVFPFVLFPTLQCTHVENKSCFLNKQWRYIKMIQ